MKTYLKKIIICIFVFVLLTNNIVFGTSVYDIVGGVFDTVVYEVDTINSSNMTVSTILVISFIIFLLIYWLVLLIIYEKEKKYDSISYLSDKELFNKYNPLIAGCIAQNRNVLSRDIIAVILNLANKGIIRLKILKDNQEKSGYKYIVYRVREKEHLMDNVEKEVHTIIFEFVHSDKEGIDLVKKLSDMPKNKESYDKFYELDEVAKNELNKIGANISKVPKPFRIYNVVLMLIAIFLCVYHVVEVSLKFKLTLSGLLTIGLVFALALMTIPLMIAFGYLILKIIGYTKRGINSINETFFNGRKIFSTSVGVSLSTLVLAIITLVITKNIYLALDEILIGLSFLIVRTDHLMLKNNDNILKDYESLKLLNEKIEHYTTLEQKNIEHITLWKEYITYAISFGISSDIVKYLKGLKLEDKIIEELKNYDLLYYSCKNYLEVFCDMEFKKNKSGYYNFFDFSMDEEVTKENLMSDMLDTFKEL